MRRPHATRPQPAMLEPELPDPRPADPVFVEPVLHDLRFSALLGASAWARLPAAVRQRFSKRLAAGMSVTYAGEIVESRRSALGRGLATLCRVIGAPLPLRDDLGVPAVVTVTEDGATGGQFWTRMYGRHHGFPQVIHSSKRFAGPTGLEEYLGGGFGIALRVSADAAALHFHSDHYFLALGGLRLRLPRWLSPGALTISHVDLGNLDLGNLDLGNLDLGNLDLGDVGRGDIDQGDGRFAFILVLRHPLFGEIIRQTGLFRERLFHTPTADIGRHNAPVVTP